MRIDEDGYRRNMRWCLWTCVCSLFVAITAFAVMFFGPILDRDAACFVSFMFTVATTMCVFAMLLAGLSAWSVRVCRALLARGDRRRDDDEA